jgi:lysozyme family protein
LNIELVTEAEGSWLPSTGALGALASGSYEVSLQLTPVTGVPALSPRALLLLALGIGLASSLYFRARGKKNA